MTNTPQQHSGQRLPEAICSASLAREIAALELELKPLLDRMATLRREERDALSREFIAANQITRDQVETSYGDEKPWFGTAWEFGKWIAANSKKRWAEWNGRIYHAVDLVNGRLPDTPGDMDSLPNAKGEARAGNATPTHNQTL
jgi:hypothetical protein